MTRRSAPRVNPARAATGGGPTATRPAENFLPYAQIAPLIREGMTGQELARAILARCGLPDKGYTVLTMPGPKMPLADALTRGVEVVTEAEADARGVTWCTAELVAR